MLLKSNLDNQSCQYRGSRDGLAIGTYKLGLYIPKHNLISFLGYALNGALTSGGLATVSFGYVTRDPGIDTFYPNFFMAPTAIAALNAAAKVCPTAALPIIAGDNLELTLSIGTADLTAGTINIFTQYFNCDFFL